jgi:hypothetical protein
MKCLDANLPLKNEIVGMMGQGIPFYTFGGFLVESMLAIFSCPSKELPT